MNEATDALVAQITDGISTLIRRANRTAAERQARPSYDVDEDSDRIDDALARAAALAEIRDRFEVVTTGVIRPATESPPWMSRTSDGRYATGSASTPSDDDEPAIDNDEPAIDPEEIPF